MFGNIYFLEDIVLEKMIIQKQRHILSNVIKKLRNDPEVLSVNDDVQYTVWTDTQIFADKCAGVYANISISMAHENTCIAE